MKYQIECEIDKDKDNLPTFYQCPCYQLAFQSCGVTAQDCVGLGNPGCPAKEVPSCERCKNKEDEVGTCIICNVRGFNYFDPKEQS